MAVFKVELDQVSYEKLVTLALDNERPPSWHIAWLVKKAIREAYTEAYPEGTAEVDAQLTLARAAEIEKMYRTGHVPRNSKPSV